MIILFIIADMAKKEYGPPCSCGAGPMRQFVARTRRNYGREFYRCPHGVNHVGGFIWTDEYYADAGHIRGGEDRSNFQYPLVYACCLCNMCLILLLLIALSVIIFRYL